MIAMSICSDAHGVCGKAVGASAVVGLEVIRVLFMIVQL
jgi:hypothetical protein